MKKKKKDIFDTPEINAWYTEMVIDGWDSMLRGENFPSPRLECYLCQSNEAEVQRLIEAFEKKYERKLKYRINGLAYISYEETPCPDKFEL